MRLRVLSLPVAVAICASVSYAYQSSFEDAHQALAALTNGDPAPATGTAGENRDHRLTTIRITAAGADVAQPDNRRSLGTIRPNVAAAETDRPSRPATDLDLATVTSDNDETASQSGSTAKSGHLRGAIPERPETPSQPTPIYRTTGFLDDVTDTPLSYLDSLGDRWAIAGNDENLDTLADSDGDTDGTAREVVTVGNGDTLMNLLINASIPRVDAHYAIEAMEDVYDPRRLRPGHELTVVFEQAEGERALAGIEFAPDAETIVTVALDNEGSFVADEAKKALTRHVAAAEGRVTSSLFAAGAAANIPMPLMAEFIRVYSWDVDFQREIHGGESFQILYEYYENDEGQVARYGDILYANLALGGSIRPIYRFETEDGLEDYFAPDGISVRRALMRTPIDGARVSSNYGMREHPILGFSRLHAGVDFAAPTGTPIYAAGDGRVERIGWVNGYGNYVEIRHNGRLATAYAHLSRFGDSLERGSRVSQGDVIGYVGATGQATGPHLHYEVHVEGDPVDPMGVDLPTGHELAGQDLDRFERLLIERDLKLANLLGDTQLAEFEAND